MKDWQDHAKKLPYGQKIKILHCGDSKSALISQNAWWIRLHCFRCGEEISIQHGPRSPAEILAARQAVEKLAELRSIPKRCITLCNEETPPQAILWVLQGGLTPEGADKLGFRFDPVTRRVCVPIDGGFLSRSVFGERPKYVKSGATYTEMYKCIKGNDVVVIVEDIMSCLAVRRAGYGSIAILGTSITNTIAMELSKYKTIVSWTDGDKAGDQAWVKLRRKMGLHDVTLKRVRTEDDPKNIHRAEVARLIGEQL